MQTHNIHDVYMTNVHVHNVFQGYTYTGFVFQGYTSPSDEAVGGLLETECHKLDLELAQHSQGAAGDREGFLQ